MKKKVVLMIISVFCFFACIAELPYELRSMLKGDIRSDAVFESHLSNFREINGDLAVDVIITGSIDTDELPAESKRVFQWEGITTARVKLKDLNKLNDIEGINSIHPGMKSELLLDISTSDHMNGSIYGGCDADYIQEQLDNGEDVFIAVIDPYPLNWQHEDFQDENGSRIAAIWDQNTSGTPPLGFSYGSEFTKSDLNAGIGPGITSNLHHGTQCMGIAAGNGNASGFTKAGMAPHASILYVEYTGNSADLIDAIAYISMKASELDPSKPVVLSMSVGAMYNHPDGSDPVAMALQSFGGVGRVSSVAAGNWYNYDCFVTGSSQYNDPVSDLSFTLTGNNTGGNDFVISRLYYNPGDDFTITVTDPGSNQQQPVLPGNDQVITTDFGELYLFHEITELGTPYIEIVVSDESGVMTAGDTWTIELEVPSEDLDDNGGWWWGWIAGVGYSADFNNYYQGAYSLNTYACAENSICVAAHDKTSGSIYSSSSSGAPDQAIKPEISCPTNASTANASGNSSYSSLCCTSGAAPHAAGAMALVLCHYPSLTSQEVIQIIMDSAFTDSQTGEVPNARWGFGKLNTKGAYLHIPFYGDVDNTSEIDAFDSSVILMLAIGENYFEETDPLPWEEWRFEWADVDGNGEIDSYDAGLILQYVVHLIYEFPVSQ